MNNNPKELKSDCHNAKVIEIRDFHGYFYRCGSCSRECKVGGKWMSETPAPQPADASAPKAEKNTSSYTQCFCRCHHLQKWEIWLARKLGRLIDSCEHCKRANLLSKVEKEKTSKQVSEIISERFGRAIERLGDVPSGTEEDIDNMRLRCPRHKGNKCVCDPRLLALDKPETPSVPSGAEKKIIDTYIHISTNAPSGAEEEPGFFPGKEICSHRWPRGLCKSDRCPFRGVTPPAVQGWDWKTEFDEECAGAGCEGYTDRFKDFIRKVALEAYKKGQNNLPL